MESVVAEVDGAQFPLIGMGLRRWWQKTRSSGRLMGPSEASSPEPERFGVGA